MRTLFKFLSLLVSFTAYGMEHLSEPIQKGVSDLLAACATADLEMVQELVSSGISVNCVNRYGFTPLHIAVTRGVETEFINLYNSPTPLPGNHAAIVEFLLSKGADIFVADKNGDTPLHIAVRNGLPMLARMLVTMGANIRRKNYSDERPFTMLIYFWINDVFGPVGLES